MAEEIRIEQILVNNQVLNALDKMQKKLTDVQKETQKASRASKDGADLAEGSYAKLEKELRDNERALKQLTLGSDEFARQKAKVDALRKSYDDAKGGLKSHNQQASRLQSLGDQGIAKIGGMVAGVASLGTVVQGVLAELEKAKRLQLESADTERTLEEALADIGQNIGGEQIAQARELITQNAPELGVTQQGLANLLGTAISAGAADLEEALEVSAASLKLTVGNAEKANALIGGTLDIASLAQSDNFEGALGQLLQVQSQVRSTNLSEFARNIGPALAAATAQGQNIQGLTTEQALETSAVFSQILKDQTGSNTATAVRQFVTRLDAFTPELQSTLKDGTKVELTQDQVDQFRQADTVQERVEQFRSQPELARQFLDQQEEGQGKIAIREFIQGSDRALGFARSAEAAIESIDQAVGAFDTLTDAVEQSTPALQAERRFQAGVERVETEGTTGLEGQARRILEQTLNKVDLPGLDAVTRKFTEARFERNIAAGRTPIESAFDAIQNIQTNPGGGFLQQDVSARDNQILELAKEEIRRLNSTVERMAAIQERQEAMQQQQQDRPVNVKVQAPPARPKEEPVPAAFIP